MAVQLQLAIIPSLNPWVLSKDGHPAAAALYRRHYSAHQYRDNRRSWPGYRNRNLICGPGEKTVLLTPGLDALFVWRKFISDDDQDGVNCAVFRNESTYLSSFLITQAEQYATFRWPRERLYTYVDSSSVKSSNPGYCFKVAGWSLCGRSKSGKLILSKTHHTPLITTPTTSPPSTVTRSTSAP